MYRGIANSANPESRRTLRHPPNNKLLRILHLVNPIADRILFLSGQESHIVVSCLFNDFLNYLGINGPLSLEDCVVLAPGSFDFFCIWKSLPEFICNVGLAHAAHHSIYFYFVLIHLLIPLFCALSGALRYLPYKPDMDKATTERSAAAICYFVFSAVPQLCPHAPQFPPQFPPQFLQELPFLKL